MNTPSPHSTAATSAFATRHAGVGRVAALSLVACGLALLGGCQSGKTAEAEENCVPVGSPEAAQAPADTTGMVLVVNKVCPIVNGDAIPGRMADERCVVEWKGKKVGMCCPGCMPKWSKLSDAQKDAALAKAM